MLALTFTHLKEIVEVLSSLDLQQKNFHDKFNIVCEKIEIGL